MTGTAPAKPHSNCWRAQRLPSLPATDDGHSSCQAFQQLWRAQSLPGLNTTSDRHSRTNKVGRAGTQQVNRVAQTAFGPSNLCRVLCLGPASPGEGVGVVVVLQAFVHEEMLYGVVRCQVAKVHKRRPGDRWHFTHTKHVMTQCKKKSKFLIKKMVKKTSSKNTFMIIIYNKYKPVNDETNE